MNDRMSDRPGSSQARARRPAAAIFKCVADVVSVALIIGLTVYLTLFFAHRPPAPVPVDESARAAIKARDDLRAEERRLLSTYGEVNPATRTLRIPVDRAMDLIVAENAKPAPAPALPSAPPSSPSPAPKPEAPAPKPEASGAKVETSAVPKWEAAAPEAPTAPPAPAVAALPPPGAARGGLTPEQVFRAVCQACHDVDGRGGIARNAMPTIPDFTDPKWHLSRTDADLVHSVTHGKGQLMLPMTDKFALAKIKPEEMVAFIRSFQPGGAVVAVPSQPQPATPPPAQPAVVTAPTTAPPATLTPEQAAIFEALAASAPTPATLAPSQPATAAATRAATSTPAPAAAPSPARAAQLRAAAAFFQANCVICHGPDGRGTAVRAVMPPLPDFTVKDWQEGRNNAQLKISILEGKGTFMPTWSGKVTPELAGDLVAYIRGFGPTGLASAESPKSDFEARIQALQKEWDELHKEWDELHEQGLSR